MEIIEALGPFGPIIILGTLGASFVAGAELMIMKAPQDPYQKLKASQRAAQNGPKKDTLRFGSSDDKLKKYSQFLEPQDADEFSAVRLRLMQSRYRGKNAVRTPTSRNSRSASTSSPSGLFSWFSRPRRRKTWAFRRCSSQGWCRA